MSKLVIFIGCIVLVAIMLSIPVLTACAFFYEWAGMLRLLLILTSVGELAILAECLYFEVIKEKNT